MKFRCYGIVLLSSWLLWNPVFSRADDGAENAALRFCVCTNAMPRAGLSAEGKLAAEGNLQGVDVAVARLLAKMLNRPCDFHACGSDTCRLENLKAGKCDVVIGLPHKSVEGQGIAWTTAYASGKFGLLVNSKNEAVRSLENLRNKRVGLVSGSLPLSAKEHKIVGFPSTTAILRGFEQANLDGALVDVDFAAWYLHDHPQQGLRLVDEFVSTKRWSIGMAVRAEETALKNDLSQAVEVCLRQAKFPRLFAESGLTYRPPLAKEDASPSKIVHDTWQRIEEGGTLVVSMDPANLPYSSADPEQPGFDVEIAKAMARELGVKMRIEWIDVHRDTAIGQLMEHECDLAFGAAVDPHAMDDEEELTGKVIYSQPYYGTGYLMVTRRDTEKVASLTELQGDKSRRLGTQAGTIADYSLRQRGYLRRLFGTQLATLTALDTGGIDYAYLWSNIGWLLLQSPDVQAQVVAGYVPEDRWNISVAMRSGDTKLKSQVDLALKQVIEQGLVANALQRYHVPYFPPFDIKPDAADANVRRGPAPRGPEPQMSRRQHSRQTYDGLSRIRSRGTLVVGLDQNNLPFSTTHPEPAGLDYELAQLLAKQLGVSLEVYWAYSSHDSYPSKLATKRFCDVILGVMPDDRFADRVAFTDPYYVASYVYAMAATDNIDVQKVQTVAAEPGIVVHGLAGRDMKPYPNLEAILAAVAAGEVPIGCVISSRARWLAEEKWPQKIRFVPLGGSADRFDICAAVRRDETDLKVALNTAFDALRKSGQLQETFARWHVRLDK